MRRVAITVEVDGALIDFYTGPVDFQVLIQAFENILRLLDANETDRWAINVHHLPDDP